MSGDNKSLRAQNLRWLCALVVLDVALLSLGASLPQAREALNTLSVLPRYGAAAFFPLATLLLSSLVSSATKARLVFWRWSNVLPGHRAFTELARNDPRIDMKALRRHVGPFPTVPSKQNALWYTLYGRVREDATVLDSHKMFLLFRDAAAISLLLAVVVTVVLWVSAPHSAAPLIAAVVFLTQYFLCVIAARNHAARFVCNVLALHSQRHIAE